MSKHSELKEDFSALWDERDYWKSRCEAAENESFLSSKYSAYPSGENRSEWVLALNKLDGIRKNEPK